MTVAYALHLDATRGAALFYSSSPSTRVARSWATTLNIALDKDLEVETSQGRVRGRVVVTPAGVERRSTSRGPVLTLLLDGDDHRAAWQPFRERGPVALGATSAAWRLGELSRELLSKRASVAVDALGRVTALLPIGRAPLADDRLEQLLGELRLSEGLERPLQAAAHRLGLTPAHLSDRFARIVGLPLKRWLLWERTRRSLRRLDTGSGVSAAFEAGFADQPHMVRTFSRQFAYTPGVLQRALSR
ncbi:MAG: helix-turn-helix domain-containing protein [Myxococcaceae bacterium]|nr:helix-turn-helix domain-containing protein [Myxococcaceae bacterium]